MQVINLKTLTRPSSVIGAIAGSTVGLLAPPLTGSLQSLSFITSSAAFSIIPLSLSILSIFITHWYAGEWNTSLDKIGIPFFSTTIIYFLFYSVVSDLKKYLQSKLYQKKTAQAFDVNTSNIK